ncbi:MAG: ribonuclease H-like domain-containing protein [Candidatus Hydrogenedentes bacterium]|nr:ribonuclease H-like domain-containing protein [Candidatus Hydrogenedentota bacterium]
MSDVQDRLKALLSTQGVMSGAEFRVRAEDLQRRRAAGEFEIDRVVPGEVIGDPEDGFYLVRSDFPLDTAHGCMTLGSALEAEARHIAVSANDEELQAFDPETAVFVDTETTGLMGGAGTVAFLIGVGYFRDGVFRLDQCFLRDYDDEEPMLHYLNDLFKGAETLVSYNGKSFDLPLLRARFITNRIPFRLESAMHFDLVHAARRFWKKRLGDCSLGNIEREVLGIERHGDVAGAEIPQLWLDYLHTRDARKLKAVFYHHKMDILSLAALTGHLSKTLEAPRGEGFEHEEDRLSLLRIHFKQKRYGDVLDLAERLLEETEEKELMRDCLEMAGFASKRLGQWQRMEDFWRLLIDAFPRHFVARHELAKYYEHRKRDLPAAERMCVEAIQYLETRAGLEYEVAGAKPLASFQHRLTRIRRKRGGQEREP